LKGVGGSFGLPEATRLAGTIETKARQGDVGALSGLLGELEEVCHVDSK
jgi:hypothetical protein